MADITSIMTANPASCRAETPLRDVARLMVEHDCGLIPVVDQDERPVGTVTDRDIAVRVVAAGKDHASATAADAMSGPCTTVTAGSSVQDAAKAMEGAKVRRVPVVDDAGRLAGIVAIADLVKAGKDEATAQVVKEVSEPGPR